MKNKKEPHDLCLLLLVGVRAQAVTKPTVCQTTSGDVVAPTAGADSRRRAAWRAPSLAFHACDSDSDEAVWWARDSDEPVPE